MANGGKNQGANDFFTLAFITAMLYETEATPLSKEVCIYER